LLDGIVVRFCHVELGVGVEGQALWLIPTFGES
jgi:hypothetical protein